MVILTICFQFIFENYVFLFEKKRYLGDIDDANDEKGYNDGFCLF
jgi:hypothetical protein